MGPRLFYAGYVLDGNPPLWPEISIMTDTQEQAESAVNFLIGQGVSFIKVYNSIPSHPWSPLFTPPTSVGSLSLAMFLAR